MANFASQEDTLLAGVAQTFNFKQKLGVNATSLVYSNDSASSTHTLAIDGFSFKVLPGEERVLSGVENWEVLTIGGDVGSTGPYRCYATSSEVPATIIKPQGGPITTSALADRAVTDAKVALNAHVASAGTIGSPTPLVVLQLDIANIATGQIEYTGLVGKHEIVGVTFVTTAVGDAGNKYQLKTATGAAEISDLLTMAAAIGTTKYAGVLKNTTLASNAGLQIDVTRAGGSSAGKCIIYCVPVA